MRILTVVAMVLGVAALAQAAPAAKAKGQTKAAYSAAVKKSVEKKGKTYNQKQVDATFKAWDTNKDGLLSKAEKTAGKKKSTKKNKKK